MYINVYEMRIFISLQILYEIFLILNTIQRNIVVNVQYIGRHVKH